MKRLFGVLLGLLCLGACEPPPPPPLIYTGDRLMVPDPVDQPRQGLKPGFEVVGYLPFYDLDRLDPAHLGHLTQVIFFGAEMNAQGEVFHGVVTPRILHLLHGAKRDYGVQILLCLVDIRYNKKRLEGMAGLIRDVPAQEKLIQKMVQLVQEGAWDGVDVDWEYPQTDKEKEAYADFLHRFKKALKPLGKILTIASSPWHVLPKRTYSALDGVNMMTYDNDAQTAAYDLILKKTKQSITTDGIPKKLYRLGLPFYGTGDKVDLPLSTIPWTIRGLKNRFNLLDSTSKAGGYAFDSTETLIKKVQMAQDLGLGGIMIWEVNQDIPGPESWIRTITRTLSRPGK